MVSDVERNDILETAFHADPHARALLDGSLRVVMDNAAWRSLTGRVHDWDYLHGIHADDLASVLPCLAPVLDPSAPAGRNATMQARLHGAHSATMCSLSITRLGLGADALLLISAMPLADTAAPGPAPSDDPPGLASAISHDLGQHARLISAFASLLLRDQLGDAVRSHVLTIANHAERLQLVLSRLVRWMRLAHEPLAPRRCDIAQLWREACAGLGDLPFRGEAVEITADRDLAICLLTELASNAVHYGGGSAELSARRMGSMVALELTDHGPGIPAAERERVLRPLVRLHTWGQVPGSGMGLAIARRIAQRHGGTLSLAAADPVGCIVQVSLPA